MGKYNINKSLINKFYKYVLEHGRFREEYELYQQEGWNSDQWDLSYILLPLKFFYQDNHSYKYPDDKIQPEYVILELETDFMNVVREFHIYEGGEFRKADKIESAIFRSIIVEFDYDIDYTDLIEKYPYLDGK